MTTDADIITALERKKAQINEIPLNVRGVEDLWVFNHLHTVIDHTKKLFEADLNDVINNMKQEVKDAREHD